MECAIAYDLNRHLTLLDKAENLNRQVESELIDGDHLNEFSASMPEAVFDGAMAFILSEATKGHFICDGFEEFFTDFKKQVKKEIENR